MAEKREHSPLEGRVGVLPPNPPPQQRQQQFAPGMAPVVGGLIPGQDDESAMKPKETIPGGLYIRDGHYVNAQGEYVDATGKKSAEKDGTPKPVKARKGETPVQDHLAAQEKAAPDNVEEGEEA